MIPSVNLDSAIARLKEKKLPDSRVGDGVPGCFSPRPTHTRSCSVTSVPQELDKNFTELHGQVVDTAETQPEWKPERFSSSNVDKSCSVLKKQGLVPDDFYRTTASPSMLSAFADSEGHEHHPCHSLPKATLIAHQKARSSSATLRHVYAAAVFDDGGTGRTSSTGSSGATDVASTSEKFALREIYVSGKPWLRVADAYPKYFRRAALNISALVTSSSGEHVAIGDCSGRVLLMRRTNQQKQEQLEGDKRASDEGKRGRLQYTNKNNSHIQGSYEFSVGRKAYTSVIDPLNSVEVTPCIQALCFLPQVGPTTYLLMANEKMPKLFKVVEVRESPLPFSAVNHIGEKNVASLTLNPLDVRRTTAMKQVTRYALNHEYNINSLCPLVDSAQFYSADDLTVKLWCIEHPDTSIETYSIKPPFEEEVQETIFGIRCFPHEPFLLFIATTAGTVRVLDIRQRLKLFHQTPLVFKNTYFDEDTSFSSPLTDCALSPCGRFVVGRDFMSVCLWDVRRDSHYDRFAKSVTSPLHEEEEQDVLQRWELYPHLRRDMEQLLQGDIIEKFSVQFLNGREVCTGGFAKTLYVLDILKDSAAPSDKRKRTPRCSNGQAFQLPQLHGTNADALFGSLRPIAMDDVRFSANEDTDALFSNTVTQLSQPLTSMNGDCSLLTSSGQAIFQLAYRNVYL
ncbi:putative protein phosphatase 2A regulatory subunit [Trypanosoma cruzi]|nr:putative protein phosphatase 2A regulatory subunit [Trypanosoma cruzi]